MKAGCMSTGGRKEEPKKVEVEEKALENNNEKEVREMILVGRKAPDFETQAFYKGKFIDVKLSNYLGKWVLLCFYPADFTFV